MAGKPLYFFCVLGAQGRRCFSRVPRSFFSPSSRVPYDFLESSMARWLLGTYASPVYLLMPFPGSTALMRALACFGGPRNGGEARVEIICDNCTTVTAWRNVALILNSSPHLARAPHHLITPSHPGPKCNPVS